MAYTIATPLMSTEIVLHEIAHHLCAADPAHGPEFVATMRELTAAVMGPEVAHVLQVVGAAEGVRG